MLYNLNVLLYRVQYVFYLSASDFSSLGVVQSPGQSTVLPIQSPRTEARVALSRSVAQSTNGLRHGSARRSLRASCSAARAFFALPPLLFRQRLYLLRTHVPALHNQSPCQLLPSCFLPDAFTTLAQHCVVIRQ